MGKRVVICGHALIVILALFFETLEVECFNIPIRKDGSFRVRNTQRRFETNHLFHDSSVSNVQNYKYHRMITAIKLGSKATTVTPTKKKTNLLASFWNCTFGAIIYFISKLFKKVLGIFSFGQTSLTQVNESKPIADVSVIQNSDKFNNLHTPLVVENITTQESKKIIPTEIVAARNVVFKKIKEIEVLQKQMTSPVEKTIDIPIVAATTTSIAENKSTKTKSIKSEAKAIKVEAVVFPATTVDVLPDLAQAVIPVSVLNVPLSTDIPVPVSTQVVPEPVLFSPLTDVTAVHVPVPIPTPLPIAIETLSQPQISSQPLIQAHTDTVITSPVPAVPIHVPASVPAVEIDALLTTASSSAISIPLIIHTVAIGLPSSNTMSTSMKEQTKEELAQSFPDFLDPDTDLMHEFNYASPSPNMDNTDLLLPEVEEEIPLPLSPSTSIATSSITPPTPIPAPTLQDKIKSTGISGTIAYILTELAFWAATAPMILSSYHGDTNEWLNIADPNDQAKFLVLSTGFVTAIRFAVPLRLAIAISLTPFVEKHITKKIFSPSPTEGDTTDF